jgi:putative transposase
MIAPALPGAFPKSSGCGPPVSCRPPNPYDNAKVENFMKTLKQEEIGGKSYRDLRHAARNLGSFIEQVYNRQRLHSVLDYRSPVEFEVGHATPTATVWPPRWGFQGMGKSTAMSTG